MSSKRFSLHLIPAMEALRARQEAAAHGNDPLWRNACVLAKALHRGRRRAFLSAEELLEAMPAQTVACWMAAYNRLCLQQVENWQEEKAALAGDSWGRLRWKVLRRLGLLPAGEQLTDRDLCGMLLQLTLDSEEELARLCPSCKRELLSGGCPVCGATAFGEDPNFDIERFEELKRRGSFNMADGTE